MYNLQYSVMYVLNSWYKSFPWKHQNHRCIIKLVIQKSFASNFTFSVFSYFLIHWRAHTLYFATWQIFSMWFVKFNSSSIVTPTSTISWLLSVLVSFSYNDKYLNGKVAYWFKGLGIVIRIVRFSVQTTLGTWPGLGTRLRYKAPGDLPGLQKSISVKNQFLSKLIKLKDHCKNRKPI